MTEIIAEIGQNHNGDMKMACELIHAAKEHGADVAKFQLFDAKTLFPKKNNAWYAYNCQTELSKDNIFRLFEECQKVGIEFLASVFDCERVLWLEDVGVKRYKIASRSIHDDLLVGKLAQLKKPLIVSLGMWDNKEFPKIHTQASVDFLFCVNQYPAELKDLHLESVDFHQYAGLSDHTAGISASLCALSRGARILEKHFTLNKKAYGPDHAGSMTPDELSRINQFRKELEILL